MFIANCVVNTRALFTNNNITRQVSSRVQNKPLLYDKKIYIVDIDGTICTKTKSDYCNSTPIYKNIDYFNSLYNKGHEIHYWTARGALSGIIWDEITVNQLKSWGVCYNTINMGKPHYDLWIDDKAINALHFCKD